jgi:hypothetical protein
LRRLAGDVAEMSHNQAEAAVLDLYRRIGGATLLKVAPGD